MPNHVYNVITVEEKYAEKLAEIAKVGLCRYYKPMPEDLKGTTSPQRIPETISQEEYTTSLTGQVWHFGLVHMG